MICSLNIKTPPIIKMVVNALKKSNDRKGTSVPAIKSYILTFHPTVNPVYLNSRLKKALHAGLEKGILVRPANSRAIGATGRFKLASMKKTKENIDPKSDSTKAAATTRKPKAKNPGADQKPDASKSKKTTDLSKEKGEKSGKGSMKSGLETAKKSPKKTKLPKPDGKSKVDKKLGQPSDTRATGNTRKNKAIKEEPHSLSEALPDKKALNSDTVVKLDPRGQGKKKN
uniref:sperm-specific H1/protamine-like protein type 2 n=1 Tax=Pristiophorus japonicus TaxID=55135 RepID=UPI00398E3530